MSKIISIGTAVPAHEHAQEDIMHFMETIYAMDAVEKRKLKFLYHHSGIQKRYSVIPDYTKQAGEWKFYSPTENLEPFPNLEKRMDWFNRYAPQLSVNAIQNCLQDHLPANEITHLITVSCTGMSAPGLDLQVMELLQLPNNIFRTSVNFMGCYAAVHALKIADAICKANDTAKVMIVCTELCTLHFQKENSADNIASSMLFADGAAAVLVTGNLFNKEGLHLDNFYSEIKWKGKKDMAWQLSSSGFLMTLSGYIPELIEEDFATLTSNALKQAGLKKEDIQHWCVHPGGRRILDAIQKSNSLAEGSLSDSHEVLQEYGNMSSPTILFVLKKMLDKKKSGKIFGAAFGPGLTMETFIATYNA